MEPGRATVVSVRSGTVSSCISHSEENPYPFDLLNEPTVVHAPVSGSLAGLSWKGRP